MKNRSRIAGLIVLISISFMLVAPTEAQQRLFRFNEAPGSLAHKRLIAEPDIANYDQPVNLLMDPAGEVSFWNGGQYMTVAPGMVLGMQVGPVYQLKTTMVIRGQIVEIYPTVEMLDRLYPPQGYATQHPVNIVLEPSDLENARAGKLVTKVIYVEDPDTALPYRLTVAQQAILEVGDGQDPLSTADRLGRPIAIVRLGSRTPDFETGQVGYYAPIPMAITEPIPDEMHSVGCCEFTCCPEELACLPKSRRDEYVCDGDDRELPVVVRRSQNEMLGLDIEDTVATFEKPNGQTDVAPSNRVCIYSPRFAAVRRVMGSNFETITQKLNIVNDKTEVTTAIRKERSSLASQNVQLQLNRTTQNASQFVDRTRGIVADNVVKLSKARESYKPYEDLALIRFGEFDASESTRISMGMQSAIAWESRLSAQIAIDNEQPVIVRDALQLQEIVSIESDTHAELRLCKMASKISAKSGETVDFTIRFDNIGRNTIRSVVIVDNLSPRLEFIDGSAECSVEAEMTTESNEAGSQLLKWTLDEPLKARAGGIIRFQCLVR